MMMRLRYLMALMALSVMTAYGAKKEEVTFNLRWWNDKNLEIVTEKKTEPCTLIEGQNNEWQGLGEIGKTTHYAVRGDVKRKTLNCFGEVHIVLFDGAHLTCTGGIKVEKRYAAKVHIHTQSDGDNRGRLTVTNSYDGAAGIGCGKDAMAGDVFIHGGTINVTGGEDAAGIGCGRSKDRDDCTAGATFIFAGDVTAQGGEFGAGIGSGRANNSAYPCGAGELYIYGGTVKAKGGDFGAGVGGGGGAQGRGSCDGGNGGKVEIYGGTLTAEGGKKASGIGGGPDIQGFNKRHGGSLKVFGGIVNATGGEYGAGIGGGDTVAGADVTIKGGTVRAQGGKNAAGIGGGYYASPGKCTISGGDVIAIAGKGCTGREAGKGSAIGFGKGPDKDYKEEHLRIDTMMMVTAGDHETNIERTFTAPERVAACQWRNFAHIEACKHSDATYTLIDGYNHRHNCVHCLTKKDLPHDFGTAANRHDCVCGQKYNDVTTALTVTHYFRDPKDPYITTSAFDKVVRNHKYVLPAPPAIEGLRFMGYSTDKEVGQMLDNEEGKLIPAGQEVTVTDELKYYARYRYVFIPEWKWADDYTSAKLTITCKLLGGSETPDVTCKVTEDVKPTDTQLGRRTYQATAIYNWKDEDDIVYKDITYTFTDEVVEEYYDVATSFTLDANEDENEAILEKYVGREANITIKNMILRKDGKLHALCLPFSAEIKGSPLEGATIYSAVNDTVVDGQLKMTFKPVTEGWILPGEPYFVKWPKGTDIEAPTFYHVYVDDGYSMAIQDQYYELGGTFDRMLFDKDDRVFFLDGEKIIELENNITDAFSNYLFIPFEKSADGEIVVTSVRLTFEGDITVEATLYDKWEGEGTAESPYLIYTRGQLRQMASTFNNDAASVNGKYFRQTANIGFDKTVENNFTPVKTFNGHYDGAGFVISGVNISAEDPNDAALFGDVKENSMIKNVIIKNSTFKGRSAAAVAIAVYDNAGVDNCHVLKDVTVSSGYSAAGVVCVVNGNGARVTGCTSQATVNGYSGVGAIVGHLTMGYVGNSIALGNSITGSAEVNAVVGYRNSGKIENCYFTAPTLSDPRAKLMPDKNQDNTDFLTRLHQRDEFLLKTELTEEQIGYDLKLNGRTLQATKNADGTWKRKATFICLPFDMDLLKLENANDVKVYRLHEVDLDNKVLQFTNEFPILKAGESYAVVLDKGTIDFAATNILVAATPKEPNVVYNADASKQVGWWCGTFKRIYRDELLEKKAYIPQYSGKFKPAHKEDGNIFLGAFCPYFSALEPLGIEEFQLKYIHTENGEETGDVTDFPADDFDVDFGIDDETGISDATRLNNKEQIINNSWYDLQGRKLDSKPTRRGVYVNNGRKVVIK